MSPVFPARRRAEEFAGLVEHRSTGRSDAHAELERFLEIVEQLRAVPAPSARPEFVSSLRERLMVAAETDLVPAEEARLTLPTRRPRDRRIAAAVGGFALVGATTSMAMAAQSALPGDVLYPLKRAIENIQTGISVDEGERGQTLLSNAEGRLAEIVTLSTEGTDEPDVVADTFNTFTDQAIEASDLLLTDYETTGREDSITQLRDFTATSLETLISLESVIPAEARDELLRAAMVLTTIDSEAAKACPKCAGAGIVDLPAILQAVEESVVDVPGTRVESSTRTDGTGGTPKAPEAGPSPLPTGVVTAPTSPPSSGDETEKKGDGQSQDPIGDLTDGLTEGTQSNGTVDSLPGLPDVGDVVDDVLPPVGGGKN